MPYLCILFGPSLGFNIRVLTPFRADGIISRACDVHVRRISFSRTPAARAQVHVKLPAGYDDLTPGHEFLPVHYVLDADAVATYVDAVGTASRSHVPPLAVAARAIASLGDLMEMPAGTIHASQEFDFFALVPVGAQVTCVAKVLRKLSRGPMRMLTLEMTVSDESGSVIQRGRSTVVLPEA